MKTDRLLIFVVSAVFFFILAAPPQGVWGAGPLNINGSTGFGGISGSGDADFNVLRIINTGDVGIHTATPLYPLDVNGNAYVSGNLGIGMAPGVIPLRTAGNAEVWGKLGIGMSPLVELDVTGNGHVSGCLQVDGTGCGGGLSLSGAGSQITFSNGTIQTTAGQPAFKRTVVVSPVGTPAPCSPGPSDFLANGTALVAALNSICNGGCPASQANPYLLKIEPGIYDLGNCNTASCRLDLCSYMELEGSGPLVTTIQGGIDSSQVTGGSGVVNGADWSALRNVTVGNYGTGTDQIAIYNKNLTNYMLIQNVGVGAIGAGTNNFGVYNENCPKGTVMMIQANVQLQNGTTQYGVYNDFSSPTINNSIIQITGGANDYGIYNTNSLNSNYSALIFGSTSISIYNGTAVYGIYNDTNCNNCNPVGQNLATYFQGCTTDVGVYNGANSTIKIDHSIIRGGTYTVQNILPGGTAFVGNTKLEGVVFPSGGGSGITCAGVYDGSYTFFSGPVCP